jgi:hypothetical protein
MPTFPSITPSDFDWLAPEYEQVEHETEDGGILHQVMFDTPGNGGLNLTFQNRPYSDYEAILAIHDQTYGSWGTLTLPMATWGGRKSELRTVIATFDPKLEWAFADEPTADGVMNGVCNIQVKLKNRIRPIALSLSAPTLGTPVTPAPTDSGTPAIVDTIPVLNCNIVIPFIPDTIGCQPIWSLRLKTPMNAGINNQVEVQPKTLIDADGNVYVSHNYSTVGVSDIGNNTIVLFKTDKDGVLQWIRKSTAPRSLTDRVMYLTPTGVAIALNRDSIAGPGTSVCPMFWGVDADGNNEYHTSFQSTGVHPSLDFPAAIHPTFHVLAGFGRTISKVVDGFIVAAKTISTGEIRGLIPLGGGNTLLFGRRASIGWICVIDSDLTIVENWVYPNTSLFGGMVSYDSSNWLVIDQFNTDAYLISKSDYTVAQGYNLTPLGLSGSYMRAMAEVVDGVATMAWREQCMAVVDFPNQQGYIKTYAPEWRTALGSGATAVPPFEHNQASGYQRDTISLANNMNVGWFSAALLSGYPRPDLAGNRILIFNAGLDLPVGLHTLEVHPPYTDDQLQITVTEATTAIATITPLPSRTSATDTQGTGVTLVTRDDFLAPFVELDSPEELEYDLQVGSVCPPKFWTSRLTVPMYPPLGDCLGSILITPSGDNYSLFDYVSPGAASVTDGSLVLTKRDVDGNVLWQRKTVAGCTPYNTNMHLDAEGGVVIAQFNDGFSDSRMWRVNASGTELWHNVYGRTISGGGYKPPVMGITQTADNSAFIIVDQIGSNCYFMRVNATTGAVVAARFTDDGNSYIAPIKLAAGGMVMCGVRAGNAWVCEFDPSLSGSFVGNQYIYPGVAAFWGMVKSSDGWIAANGTHIFLLDNTYTVTLALAIGIDMSGANRLRAIQLDGNDILHLSYTGNQLLTLDIPNRIAGLKRQEVARVEPSTSTRPLEKSSHPRPPRQTLDLAAGLGVGYTSSDQTVAVDGDKSRIVFHGIGLDAGVGTWILNTFPPYTTRYDTLTVTSPNVAMTTSVIPTRTAASATAYGDLTPLDSTPAWSEKPFEAGDDTTLTWDLQTYTFT